MFECTNIWFHNKTNESRSKELVYLGGEGGRIKTVFILPPPHHLGKQVTCENIFFPRSYETENQMASHSQNNIFTLRSFVITVSLLFWSLKLRVRKLVPDSGTVLFLVLTKIIVVNPFLFNIASILNVFKF